MSPTAPLLCVHACAFGKDVVFRFADARFAIEGGALAVRSGALPHADFMAFAPGVWKAAWHEDDKGAPLGLLPDGHGSPPMMGPAAAAEPTEPATGPAAGPDHQRAARADLERRALEALDAGAYPGLARFADALGEPPAEVERSLVSALQRQGLDPDKIAVAPMQARLDAMLPALIAARNPQGVRDIMHHLRGHPDTRECDYVQLHIWLRRNPGNRPA